MNNLRHALFSLISISVVQYGLARGAKVLGVDAGSAKKTFVEGLGALFLDFATSKDLVADVTAATSGGAHAVIVTSGHPNAFKDAADVLRIGGALCTSNPQLVPVSRSSGYPDTGLEH